MVAVGLGLTMLVVYQNLNAAANITIEDGQPLVSTGLYGIVRHPMYFGNATLMVGHGCSYRALLIVPVGTRPDGRADPRGEKMLHSELDGYRQYTQKVCYCLVPLIW